jgi:peptide/nickel transport system permease protein
VSRGPWRELRTRLWRRAGVRAASSVLVALSGVALGADFLASDKPLVASVGGELLVLPAFTDPPRLRPHGIASLRGAMAEDDWLVPPLIPWGPNEQDKGRATLEAPSGRHWLGTDGSRRDVLARLIHGTRVALGFGIATVGLYVIVGTLLGLLAGYVGGFTDALISRVVEALLALPVFFVVLAVLGVVEGAGLGTTLLVMALVSWTKVARLVRAETLRVKQLDFVSAAVASGSSAARVMLRHILPHTITPVLISASFGLAGVVLTEASLTFLGFGASEHVPTWGGLLHGAVGRIHAWWLVLAPGGALFALVLSYNVLGEALRDVLDPALRE